MKSFLKTVLAVIVGILIVSLLGLFMISGLASAGSSEPVMPREGVLVLDMSKISVTEQRQEADPISMIQGGGTNATIGLWDAVQAINTAAEDPGVKYIYLKPDGNMSDLAIVQELRKALANVRAGGKAIVAYTENPTTGGYYLASVADKVFMTSYPGGLSTMVGVSTQLVFLKDLLDKLGVNVQLIRHGKYKYAGEMFIRSSASPENLEQNQVMVNSMWKSLSGEIAASRGFSVEKLDADINELKLCLPEDFLREGYVDELLSGQQLRDKLASLAVVDSYKDLKTIGFADYVTAKVKPNLKAKQKIAVIYANGEIAEGASGSNIDGDRFAGIIRKIREDEQVKVVVLRVNSPGGSVISSEKIRSEMALLKAEKSVIASYGGYAASGGYWISAGCDKIYTDPVTLTGSIGVFGMIPDLSKTLKDIAHVNITSVSTHKHGDMMSLISPMDAEETAFMQRSIEDVYDNFVGIVSEARGLSRERVDEIAQGRVWTGADAVGIGLADEIGTLEDAIRWAAKTAGDEDLANWNVSGYPKPQTTMELLMETLTGGSTDANVFAGTPLEDAAAAIRRAATRMEGRGVLARMPYEIVIR